MAGNSIGKLFKLTSFGESHGVALGGVIDGCPAGVPLSVERIQEQLDRRRPGQSAVSTPRNEADKVEILSGIFNGHTTGMPIGFIIRNQNQQSKDYDTMKELFRPSHADFTWHTKYGERDHRGGGRSSAREHVARVVAGSVARQVLEHLGVSITAYTSQVGTVTLNEEEDIIDLNSIENNVVRCPNAEVAELMMQEILSAREEGDSVGGCVSCIISGVPVGLGEPVFDRAQARLAYAMLSINAAKGFEYGKGFASAAMRGSEHNDPFTVKGERITTETNFSGGIQGGITNGEDIFFRVAFKPIATIMQEQHTVNKQKEEVTFTAHGRHDPCVVARAVPVVEAMAAVTLLDMVLENRAAQL
ncbi:MAG: chorismate synthase [Marinifilaceae bacterium]